MEKNKTNINYIFYLQTKDELESSYFMLAEIFAKLNINLLPVMVSELNALDKTHKNHLIVFRNDLTSGMIFNQLRRTFIDLALNSGRIHLYDVSSFSEIEIAQKLAGKEIYKFIPLPANIKQVAMNIAVDYFKDRNKQEEWPGGKRAKLPSMNTEN
jgi:hypothetical protein